MVLINIKTLFVILIFMPNKNIFPFPIIFLILKHVLTLFRWIYMALFHSFYVWTSLFLNCCSIYFPTTVSQTPLLTFPNLFLTLIPLMTTYTTFLPMITPLTHLLSATIPLHLIPTLPKQQLILILLPFVIIILLPLCLFPYPYQTPSTKSIILPLS